MQNSIFRHGKSVPQSKDFDVSYVWILFSTRKSRNCSKCAAARCFCLCFRHVFRLSNTFWALWTISYEIQGGVKRMLVRTNESTKYLDAMYVCDVVSTKHSKIRCTALWPHWIFKNYLFRSRRRFWAQFWSSLASFLAPVAPKSRSENWHENCIDFWVDFGWFWPPLGPSKIAKNR